MPKAKRRSVPKGVVTRQRATAGKASMLRVTDRGSQQRDLVRLDNLDVAVMRDGAHWFAQALQVDYAAQGNSLADVKARFEAGLSATVDAHLREFNSLNNLLKFAPDAVLRQIADSPEKEGIYSYSHLSIHRLPFKKIKYVKLEVA